MRLDRRQMSDEPAWQKRMRELLFPWSISEQDRLISKLGWFEYFMIVTYITNMVILAASDGTSTRAFDTKAQVLKSFELIFTILYVVEISLSNTAFGWSGLLHPVRMLDAALVLGNLVVLIVYFGGFNRDNSGYSFLSVRCCLRLLRPFFMTTSFPAVRLFVVSVAQSMMQLGDVFVLFILFLLWFGVAGVYQFGGVLMKSCVNDFYEATQTLGSGIGPITGSGRYDFFGDASTVPGYAYFQNHSSAAFVLPDGISSVIRLPIDTFTNIIADQTVSMADVSLAVTSFAASFGAYYNLRLSDFVCGAEFQTSRFEDYLRIALVDEGPYPVTSAPATVRNFTNVTMTPSLTPRPLHPMRYYEPLKIAPIELYTLLLRIFPFGPDGLCSTMQTCSTPQGVLTGYTCPYGFGCKENANPYDGFIGFDNLMQALLTLFICTTFEMWYTIMFLARDATDVLAELYFLVLIIAGPFLVMNLTQVVLTVEYEKAKMEERRRLKHLMMKIPVLCMPEDGDDHVLERPSTMSATNSSVDTPAESGFASLVRGIMEKQQHTSAGRELLHKKRQEHKTRQQLKEDFLSRQRRMKVARKRKEVEAAKRKVADELAVKRLGGAMNNQSFAGSPLVTNMSMTGVDVVPNASMALAASSPNKRTSPSKAPLFLQQQMAEQGAARKGRKRGTSPAQRGLQNHNDIEMSPLSIANNNSFGSRDSPALRPQDTPNNEKDGEFESDDDSEFKHVDIDMSWKEYEYQMAFQETQRRIARADAKGNPYRVKMLKLNFFVKWNVVETNWFSAISILMAATNIAVVCAEHYGQSQEQTDVTSAMYFFFATYFTVELVVRFMAVPPLSFIQSAMNVFEVVIVALNWIDLMPFMDGVNVLRASATLRVVILMKLFPGVYQWLKVISVAIQASPMLLLLLLQFMFIFSAFGVQAFGGQFCGLHPSDDNEEFVEISYNFFNYTTNATEIAVFAKSVPSGKPCPGLPHANFDNFGYALISSFIVLAQEDWGYLMIDSMAAFHYLAAIPFVVFVYVGNYILLSLLVAILLSAGFQEEDDESLEQLLEEDQKQKTKQMLQEQALKNEEEEEERRRGMLYDDLELNQGDDDDDGDELESIADDEKSNKSAPKDAIMNDYIVTKTGRIRKKSSTGLLVDKFFMHFDRSKKWAKFLMEHFATHMFIAFVIVFGTISMALFDPLAAPDTHLLKTLRTIDITVTVIYCIEVILNIHAYGIVKRATSYLRRDYFNILDFVLVTIGVAGVIVAEMQDSSEAAKVIQMLAALRPLRLIKRSNGMRLVLSALIQSLPQLKNVMLCTLAIFIVFGATGIYLLMGRLRTCIIPDSFQGYASYPQLGKADCTIVGGSFINLGSNFDDMGAAFMAMYQIMTLEGWTDLMWSSTDTTEYDGGSVWMGYPGISVFFVLAAAFCGLFQTNLIEATIMDAYNAQKRKVAFQKSIFVTREQTAWLETNNRIARYLPIEGRRNRASNKRKEDERLRNSKSDPLLLQEEGGSGDHGSPGAPAQRYRRFGQGSDEDSDNDSPDGSPKTKEEKKEEEEDVLNQLHTKSDQFRTKIRKIVRANWFINFNMGLIFLNFVAMAVEHYPMDIALSDALEALNVVFSVLFCIEAGIKIAGETFKVYFGSKWNRLDFGVAVISILSIAISAYVNPKVIALVRGARVLRLARLTKGILSIDKMIGKFGVAVLNLIHMFGFIVILFFVFGILGMRLFGRVRQGVFGDVQGIDSHTNFLSIHLATVTLARIMTGGDWHSIMYSTAIQSPLCDPQIGDCGLHILGSYIYFLIFSFFSIFVLKNLLTAVILDSFAISGSNRAIRKRDAEMFYSTWHRFDADSLFSVAPFDVLPLVRIMPISSPLSLHNANPKKRVSNELAFLTSLGLHDLRTRVSIATVVDALCFNAYRVPPPENHSFLHQLEDEGLLGEGKLKMAQLTSGIGMITNAIQSNIKEARIRAASGVGALKSIAGSPVTRRRNKSLKLGNLTAPLTEPTDNALTTINRGATTLSDYSDDENSDDIEELRLERARQCAALIVINVVFSRKKESLKRLVLEARIERDVRRRIEEQLGIEIPKITGRLGNGPASPTARPQMLMTSQNSGHMSPIGNSSFSTHPHTHLMSNHPTPLYASPSSPIYTTLVPFNSRAKPLLIKTSEIEAMRIHPGVIVALSKHFAHSFMTAALCTDDPILLPLLEIDPIPVASLSSMDVNNFSSSATSILPPAQSNRVQHVVSAVTAALRETASSTTATTTTGGAHLGGGSNSGKLARKPSGIPDVDRRMDAMILREAFEEFVTTFIYWAGKAPALQRRDVVVHLRRSARAAATALNKREKGPATKLPTLKEGVEARKKLWMEAGKVLTAAFGMSVFPTGGGDKIPTVATSGGIGGASPPSALQYLSPLTTPTAGAAGNVARTQSKLISVVQQLASSLGNTGDPLDRWFEEHNTVVFAALAVRDAQLEKEQAAEEALRKMEITLIDEFRRGVEDQLRNMGVALKSSSDVTLHHICKHYKDLSDSTMNGGGDDQGGGGERASSSADGRHHKRPAGLTSIQIPASKKLTEREVSFSTVVPLSTTLLQGHDVSSRIGRRSREASLDLPSLDPQHTKTSSKRSGKVTSVQASKPTDALADCETATPVPNLIIIDWYRARVLSTVTEMLISSCPSAEFAECVWLFPTTRISDALMELLEVRKGLEEARSRRLQNNSRTAKNIDDDDDDDDEETNLEDDAKNAVPVQLTSSEMREVEDTLQTIYNDCMVYIPVTSAANNTSRNLGGATKGKMVGIVEVLDVIVSAIVSYTEENFLKEFSKKVLPKMVREMSGGAAKTTTYQHVVGTLHKALESTYRENPMVVPLEYKKTQMRAAEGAKGTSQPDSIDFTIPTFIRLTITDPHIGGGIGERYFKPLCQSLARRAEGALMTAKAAAKLRAEKYESAAERRKGRGKLFSSFAAQSIQATKVEQQQKKRAKEQKPGHHKPADVDIKGLKKRRESVLSIPFQQLYMFSLHEVQELLVDGMLASAVRNVGTLLSLYVVTTQRMAESYKELHMAHADAAGETIRLGLDHVKFLVTSERSQLMGASKIMKTSRQCVYSEASMHLRDAIQRATASVFTDADAPPLAPYPLLDGSSSVSTSPRTIQQQQPPPPPYVAILSSVPPAYDVTTAFLPTGEDIAWVVGALAAFLGESVGAFQQRGGSSGEGTPTAGDLRVRSPVSTPSEKSSGKREFPKSGSEGSTFNVTSAVEEAIVGVLVNNSTTTKSPFTTLMESTTDQRVPPAVRLLRTLAASWWGQDAAASMPPPRKVGVDRRSAAEQELEATLGRLSTRVRTEESAGTVPLERTRMHIPSPPLPSDPTSTSSSVSGTDAVVEEGSPSIDVLGALERLIAAIRQVSTSYEQRGAAAVGALPLGTFSLNVGTNEESTDTPLNFNGTRNDIVGEGSSKTLLHPWEAAEKAAAEAKSLDASMSQLVSPSVASTTRDGSRHPVNISTYFADDEAAASSRGRMDPIPTIEIQDGSTSFRHPNSPTIHLQSVFPPRQGTTNSEASPQRPSVFQLDPPLTAPPTRREIRQRELAAEGRLFKPSMSSNLVSPSNPPAPPTLSSVPVTPHFISVPTTSGGVVLPPSPNRALPPSPTRIQRATSPSPPPRNPITHTTTTIVMPPITISDTTAPTAISKPREAASPTTPATSLPSNNKMTSSATDDSKLQCAVRDCMAQAAVSEPFMQQLVLPGLAGGISCRYIIVALEATMSSGTTNTVTLHFKAPPPRLEVLVPPSTLRLNSRKDSGGFVLGLFRRTNADAALSEFAMTEGVSKWGTLSAATTGPVLEYQLVAPADNSMCWEVDASLFTTAPPYADRALLMIKQTGGRGASSTFEGHLVLFPSADQRTYASRVIDTLS